MAYNKSNANAHTLFEQKMIDTYQVKVMGDLVWFLGIRIIRDRVRKKTWLIQDAFIDKVCARFNIQLVGKSPETCNSCKLRRICPRFQLNCVIKLCFARQTLLGSWHAQFVD